MAWGLDFQLQSCINGAPHEHIGIVDTQWVVHNKIPSLGSEVCANLYSILSFNQHNKTHSGIHRREVGDSGTSGVWYLEVGKLSPMAQSIESLTNLQALNSLSKCKVTSSKWDVKGGMILNNEAFSANQGMVVEAYAWYMWTKFIYWATLFHKSEVSPSFEFSVSQPL